MQKTRRLMDMECTSFQMFLILLSFFAVGSYSQISEVHVTLYSSNVKEILRYLGGACTEAKITGENCIRHFVWATFSLGSISRVFH